VVLDLGANVGCFTLRAAQKAKHVYAVEPLYTDELVSNIALNEIPDKVSVIHMVSEVEGNQYQVSGP